MKKNTGFCRRLAALLLCIALLCLPALASHPNPSDSFYVLDQSGVLSTETVNHILNRAADLDEQTGAQLCVVTVDFTGSDDISDYAYSLFNDWGIGSAEKNNGVLLLLVIGAEDYYCLQGSGLEDVLPSSQLQIILDEKLEPDFAEGDYDAGTLKTADELLDRLYNYYGVTESEDSGTDTEYAPENDETDASPVADSQADGGSLWTGVGILGVLGAILTFLVRKVFVVILTIAIILLVVLLLVRRPRHRGFFHSNRGFRHPPYGGGYRMDPPPPPGMHRPTPPPGGWNQRPRSGGGFGGNPGGGFGHPGGGHSSGFGGGHSPGGGHSGGGGMSRGGGAGRR